MLPNIGWGELVVILVIVLLLFGAKRLPELAQSLGKSLKIFKKNIREDPLEDKKDSPPENK